MGDASGTGLVRGVDAAALPGIAAGKLGRGENKIPGLCWNLCASGHGDVLAEGSSAFKGPDGDGTSCALALPPLHRGLSGLAEELLAQGNVLRGQHVLGASWGKESFCHPQREGSSGGEGESLERLRGDVQKGSGWGEPRL